MTPTHPAGGTEPEGPDWKRIAVDLRERLERCRERTGRLHRRILDKEVLRQSLPLRMAMLAGRTGAHGVADRERRFRDASPAYAAAGEFPGDARQISIDELVWWLPLPNPDDPVRVERAVAHQHFPYRTILQTRELAIGGAMIDIGANIGRMCIPRVILGDAAVAYCVEPDPLNYACLVRNAWDNGLRGLVLPDCAAIGGRIGETRFELSRTAGGHRVVHTDRKVSGRTISVPMITLDAWVARMGIELDQVTFVKVDVQGSEVEVLRGAAEVLARRHISWQIEIDPHLLEKASASVADLLALVERHFTHFIDFNADVPGARVRPVAELRSALGYVDGSEGNRTDILACTLTGHRMIDGATL